MELHPDIHIRELRKALELPQADCSYQAVVRTGRKSLSAVSFAPGEKPHLKPDPKGVMLLYRAGDYKKVFIAFERAKPEFAPRRARVSMYMPDGKLRTETVERKSKTELDHSAVGDLIEEFCLDFDRLAKRSGNKLPAFCA